MNSNDILDDRSQMKGQPTEEMRASSPTSAWLEPAPMTGGSGLLWCGGKRGGELKGREETLLKGGNEYAAAAAACGL